MGNWINNEAASRIVGQKVIKVWQMKNGAVGVVYLNNGKRCSTLVSRKKFMYDGLELRKTGAVGMAVYKRTCASDSTIKRFYVDASHRQGFYFIELQQNSVSCTCPDFQAQVTHGNGFTRPFCKHYAAVLYTLNATTLTQAMAA